MTSCSRRNNRRVWLTHSFDKTWTREIGMFKWKTNMKKDLFFSFLFSSLLMMSSEITWKSRGTSNIVHQFFFFLHLPFGSFHVNFNKVKENWQRRSKSSVRVIKSNYTKLVQRHANRKSICIIGRKISMGVLSQTFPFFSYGNRLDKLNIHHDELKMKQKLWPCHIFVSSSSLSFFEHLQGKGKDNVCRW